MNATTKYSINTYQDYAYLFNAQRTNSSTNNDKIEEESKTIVDTVDDYCNTNLLDLPKDFKLNN